MKSKRNIGETVGNSISNPSLHVLSQLYCHWYSMQINRWQYGVKSDRPSETYRSVAFKITITATRIFRWLSMGANLPKYSQQADCNFTANGWRINSYPSLPFHFGQQKPRASSHLIRFLTWALALEEPFLLRSISNSAFRFVSWYSAISIKCRLCFDYGWVGG